MFCNIPNTPDVVFLDRDRREVLILEIGCVYDLYMDMAFNDKIMKYQPIRAKLSDLGYQSKLVVLIFGSLGHDVHNLVFSGLRALQQKHKTASKVLLHICSYRQPCSVVQEMFCVPLNTIESPILSLKILESCLLNMICGFK